MSPAPTEPRGMLTMEEMVAEVYRTVCVSRAGEPCLIDEVNSQRVRIDGHESWIRGHEAKPEPSLGDRLSFAFLSSVVGSVGVGFVAVVGWGLVTVLRRALGAP